MNAHVRRFLLLGSICLLLCITACEPSAQKDRPATDPASVASQTTDVPAPALTRHDSHGEATVVGTVVYRRDQGGFVAVADLVPGIEPTTSAHLLAALVQADGSRVGPDLIPLVGAYCSFSGVLRQETSMSPLPEFVVESYRVIVAAPGR